MPEQLLFFVQEMAGADQLELILGTWCMAAHDMDRQLSTYARQSWEKFVSVTRPLGNEASSTLVQGASSVSTGSSKLRLDFASFSGIWGFVQRVILDPSAVYLNVNPPQPVVPPPAPKKGASRSTVQVRKDEESSTRSRAEEEEENELDRNARLRMGAFGAAEWALSMWFINGVFKICNNFVVALCTVCLGIDTLVHMTQEPKQIEEFITPLDNVALWTILYHAQAAPFVPAEIQSFGWDQPGVRKSAWSLLQTLITSCKGTAGYSFQTLLH